ncbi:MAG: rRNA processing protein RimM [Myxococcales bacterium]|nr:rRNA processing protein RimM [Myxococcales bacterium]
MSNARGRRRGRLNGDAPRPPAPAPAPYDPETVVLGVAGRPHGIRGELWLRPHNEHGRSFEGLRSLLFVKKGGVGETHQIASLRPSPDGALVKLVGVDSREAAAALTLAELRVPRASLPPLAPGEYYVNDVIGCSVTHADGRALGVVAGTFWNGAQDLMIVKGGPGDTEAEERLIPLISEFVVTVDVPGRAVVVSWDDPE